MKMVIGYDGSKAANAALKDLVNAGLPRAAQVRMVFAVPPLLPLESLAPAGEALAGGSSGGGVIAWYADAYKQAIANQKIVLDRALEQTREAAALVNSLFPAWAITTETSVDIPSHAILTAAEQWKADLIMVGSTGWNFFGKIIIGSVADKVLNHAHCTVRLARGGKQLKSRPPKLLIAFDGSDHALEAVRQIAARKWPKGAEARVLAVSEFQLRMGDVSMALTRTLGLKNGRSSAWPWMEKKLEKAAEALRKAGIKTNTVMTIDEPRRAILNEARKMKADAIVMGTHGLTGLKRFLLGSVSASVAAHAPCTVEIIRAPVRKKPAKSKLKGAINA